jgi:hypothetical protein
MKGSYSMESIQEFLKKNVRTVVVALVIVGTIVTVSMSGSDQNKISTDEPQQDSTAVSTDSTTETTENQQETATAEVVIGSEPQAGPVKVDEDKSMYRSTVRPGDNQTVIARQMLNEFLADESKSLSAEQRLYVETVVVDSLLRNNIIFAGDVIEVEKSAIAASVDASAVLSETQLARWTTYL